MGWHAWPCGCKPIAWCWTWSAGSAGIGGGHGRQPVASGTWPWRSARNAGHAWHAPGPAWHDAEDARHVDARADWLQLEFPQEVPLIEALIEWLPKGERVHCFDAWCSCC